MNAVAPAVTSVCADRTVTVPAPERSVATSRLALQLRPYQEPAVERSIKAVLAGRRVLVVMPTGSGKSLVIAEICRRLPHLRIAVLTHVKELVEQNHGELLALWPEAPAGICCAGLGRFDTDARILFGSVQTVANRLDDLGPIDLILVDEAHLVPRTADTRYQQVFDAFDHEAGQRLPVVGLTATPFRLDTGRLDQGHDALFDNVAVDVPITELVAAGWLAPLVSKAPEERLSTEGVHVRGGEFIAGELQQAIDRPDINARVVTEMVERGAERRAWLVYCAGIEHAEHVAALLRQHGIEAATVFGETARAERDSTIEAFRAGRLRALDNVNVLTTGSNVPAVDLLAILRPTASPGLHVQMLGRGTRTAPGKAN